MIEIIEQLEDYCDCLPKKLKDEVLEKNLQQLIHLISNITCWSNSECETFLNSERIEIVELPSFDFCSCDGGILEFNPWYTQIDPESFEVTLVRLQGIEEEVIEIDKAHYQFSELFQILKIDVSNYIESLKCAGCPPDYRMIVKYNAGYELLPECLLPLFCDLLHVLFDMNKCDCSSCQTCKKGDDGAEGYIEFNDEVSPKLDEYLQTLIKNGYKRTLGLISLCGRETDAWSVIV